MGVGSVGTHLRPYEECDTYLSRDAGLSWKRVQRGAHMYEVGDQGAVMVLVNDEEATKVVKYSWDEGNTWYVPFSSCRSPLRLGFVGKNSISG